MSLDKNYLDQFIKVTEYAAYGASPFIGKVTKMLLTKELLTK